jgi:integral membrane sensor domain MASE1
MSATGLFALVFVAYLAGAVVSAFAFGSTKASAFFVPGGITVAALLLTRRSVWPVIVAALVAAELLVDRRSGLSWSISAGFALGNAVEAVVGAAVVRAWCGGTPDLRRTRDLSIYVIGAAGVGALCGAVIGGLTKWWAFGVPLLQGVTQWFAGDAISVLVVGTSILLWRTQSHMITSRPLETAAVLLAAAGLSVVGFSTPIPPGTTVLPILAVAALRLGVLGTALTGVVVAAIGNYLTGSNLGLLGEAHTAEPIRVALAQLFVAVLVVTAMVIAQEVAKRTTAVRERDVERVERRRLESLTDVAQELTAALTPVDVGRVLERQLPRELGATAFTLGLFSHDGTRLDWVAGAGGEVLTGAGSAGGVALDEPCIATEAVRSAKPAIAGARAAWPLFAGEDVTGVLLLGRDREDSFDAEQQTYISALTAMVGEALVRAQSYADEHARAVVLHAALHPAHSETTAGIEYCVCYEPADTVHGLGGDWYDVMSLPKGHTYLAVGDVVGHGLPAVEDMAQLRSAARTLAHRGQSPAQVLADLNSFTDDVLQGQFSTVVLAVVDHTAGTLTYSSAGHPPAFLRKAATGRVVRLDDANGPVLGPVTDAAFQDGVIPVDAGDVLVMYTDGLVEGADLPIPAGIAYAEKLVADWPAGALIDCRALTDTLAPPPRADDICVLVVRFD